MKPSKYDHPGCPELLPWYDLCVCDRSWPGLIPHFIREHPTYTDRNRMMDHHFAQAARWLMRRGTPVRMELAASQEFDDVRHQLDEIDIAVFATVRAELIAMGRVIGEVYNEPAPTLREVGV